MLVLFGRAFDRYLGAACQARLLHTVVRQHASAPSTTLLIQSCWEINDEDYAKPRDQELFSPEHFRKFGLTLKQVDLIVQVSSACIND